MRSPAQSASEDGGCRPIIPALMTEMLIHSAGLGCRYLDLSISTRSNQSPLPGPVSPSPARRGREARVVVVLDLLSGMQFYAACRRFCPAAIGAACCRRCRRH